MSVVVSLNGEVVKIIKSSCRLAMKEEPCFRFVSLQGSKDAVQKSSSPAASAISKNSSYSAATTITSMIFRCFIASGTASTTTTTTARSAFSILRVETSAFRPDCNRHPLQDSAFVVPRRISPIIHGKIAADQVSTHGCVFCGEYLVLIGRICMILAIVDPDHALDTAP